jgi:hypothetical protein
MISVLLGRGLDELGRGQTSLLPLSFSHLLSVGSLFAAAAALLGGSSELGVVLAASLAARGALDIPIPALLLELSALYLPFVRPTRMPGNPAETVPAAPSPTSPHVDDIP